MAWHRFYDPEAGMNMLFTVRHAAYENDFPLTSDIRDILRCTHPGLPPPPRQGYARPLSDYDHHVHPTEGQERIFILTTSGSYVSKVSKQLQVDNTYYLLKPPKGDLGRRSYPTPMTMPSWILIDEYHHAKSPEAPPYNHIKLLQKQCHDGIPYSIFLSGTPLETGPANFLGPLGCLIDPRLPTPSATSTHHVTVDELVAKDKKFQAIQSRVKKHGTAPTDLVELQAIADWAVNFLVYWCIRRTERGKWFGQPLLSLPLCKHIDVMAKFPISLRDRLTKLENKFETAAKQKENQEQANAASFRQSVTRQVLLAATIPPRWSPFGWIVPRRVFRTIRSSPRLS